MSFPNIPGLPGPPPPGIDPYAAPAPDPMMDPMAMLNGPIPAAPGDPFGPAMPVDPAMAPPMAGMEGPTFNPMDPFGLLPEPDPMTKLLGSDPLGAGVAAGLAGGDPMLGEQMPQASPRDELDAYDEEPDIDIEPMYPAWLFKKVKHTLEDGRVAIEKTLTPPRKPTAGQCQDWIESDRIWYGALLDRDAQMLRFYRRTHSGIFDGTELEPEQEVFRSVEPTIQLNKLCHMIGYMNVRFDKPFKTAPEEADAQDLEDIAAYLWQLWKKRHRGAGGGNLQHDLVFSAALYGRVCVRVLCDPDDPTEPVSFKLYDPACVFPIWGDKYGLIRVSVIESATLGEIIDEYDPSGSRRLAKKFGSTYQKDAGDLDYTREVEVREVWTRWYRYVEADGIVVLPPTAHEYGKVPWVVTPLSGELAGSSTPHRQVLTKREIERGQTGTGGSMGIQWDIRERFHSFLQPMEDAVRTEEAIMSLLVTQLEQDTDPPQVTTSPYPDQPEPVDTAPGGNTKRRPAEVTEPVQFPTRTAALLPIVETLKNQRVKAWLPDNVFGILDGANVSGFTENTLMASAKDRIEPYIDAVCVTIAEVIELALYEYQGFGHLYVDDPDGKWEVPANQRDGMGEAGGPPQEAMMLEQMTGAKIRPIDRYPGVVAITPQIIKRMGPDILVKLELVDWRELATMANVAGVLIDKGVWSRWTAMDRLGIDNPRLEERRVAVEQAKMAPEYVKGVYLPKMLYESGDTDAFTGYILGQLLPELMGGGAGAMGMPAAPGTPGGAPILPPGLNANAGLGAGMMGGPQDPTAGGSVAGIQSVQGDSQPSVAGGSGAPGSPRSGADASIPGATAGI